MQELEAALAANLPAVHTTHFEDPEYWAYVPATQFAQLLGDAPVVGRQSRAGIGEEDHRVGFGDCLLGLLRHLREDALGGAGLKPPGIDHVVRAAAEQTFAIVAVARHAGHVHDDRIARAGEAVEEGALADVGPAD